MDFFDFGVDGAVGAVGCVAGEGGVKEGAEGGRLRAREEGT